MGTGEDGGGVRMLTTEHVEEDHISEEVHLSDEEMNQVKLHHLAGDILDDGGGDGISTAVGRRFDVERRAVGSVSIKARRKRRK